MLKLKEGFVLRQVAGETVVIPSGNEINLNMMITLNETGEFLWEYLTHGTDAEGLVAALLEEYDVDETTARSSVDAFVAKLNEYGFLQE